VSFGRKTCGGIVGNAVSADKTSLDTIIGPFDNLGPGIRATAGQASGGSNMLLALDC